MRDDHRDSPFFLAKLAQLGFQRHTLSASQLRCLFHRILSHLNLQAIAQE